MNDISHGNKDTYTVARVTDSILDAEELGGLFNLKIGDIKVYQHFRRSLYNEIIKQLGVHKDMHETTTYDILTNSLSYLKHAVLQNDLWGIKEHEVVIIEHPRKIVQNGTERDIYTDSLLKKLQYDYCVIKWPFQGHYCAENREIKDKIIYYDYYAIKRRIYKKLFVNKDVILSAQKVAKKIDESIQNCFKCQNLQIKDFIRRRIIDAYVGVPIAVGLLEKINPRLIILLVNYGQTYITHAAKKLSIPVVELQHGVIGRFHLGYHYPHVRKDTIDAFPDYLFTFGVFWNKAASFPVASTNVIATGFSYFDEQRRKYHKEVNKKSILFISQNLIYHELAKIAVDVAKKFPEYKIIFKLHPGQYSTWKENLSVLKKSKTSNIVIVSKNDVTIYDLFSESFCQIGGFSTAIYEGLGWGLKTIICNVPGWEYMEPLIEQGKASFAKNSDEVISLINEKDYKQINVEEVFKSNPEENILAEIKKNIKTLRFLQQPNSRPNEQTKS